jgi:elongation factor G
VVDVLAAQQVPDSMGEQVAEIKGALVELAAETDDTLIEKFLDGQELSPDEIGHGLIEAVASGGCIPVFACVGPSGLGAEELIENIVRILPNPEHRPRVNADDDAISAAADAPFFGQVWRVLNDPFVGQMTFIRVLGGTLKADSEVHNITRKHKERVGSLLIVNGSKQETTDAAGAGGIVAIPKLKDTHVGDTLSSIEGTSCRELVFPSPVLFQAVTAKTNADEDKIGLALSRVCEEDPTLKVVRDPATHEIVLQGLGDVHIDVAVGLMKSRSNVEVNLHTPRVPYRETVTGRGEGRYKHKKQSGGRGQYGEVYLRVEPKTNAEEEWFVNAIVGGAIPGNFIPAVQKGLVEGMITGSMAGYPVTDVKITVYDGSYHDVDSSEVAFKIAASRALREALANAKPVLLEPVMSIKIVIPDQFMGDINGDLNHRRGKILGMGPEDGLQAIVGEAPQSELFRYAAELRSMTGGQGSFEMEYARYEHVPANIAQKVVAQTEKTKEEEA